MGHSVLQGRKGGHLPSGRYDGRLYAREMATLLRWGAERGINGIDILHSDRGGYADPGGVLLELEAASRGIPFAVGGHVGHGYPHFIPEGMFDSRPDLFRVDAEGRRTPTGNVCTSNCEALGRAVGELTKLLDRHPGAEMVHIFPDDTCGGSWCRCPKCADLTPTQQYARLISAVAGALDARRQGVEASFLLYHDTLSLPDSAAGGFLPPNVYGLYAPRERCYAHAIDDAACPRNRRYWSALRDAVTCFAGRLDVFEYYGDTILWQYFNVAIPHVIAADLRAYREMAVREVQALAFGTSSLWAHGLNLAVFAWLAAGIETDVDSAIARYATERFGPEACDDMVAYYDALETAQAGYLGFCGYEDDWLHDLRGGGAASPWSGEHRRRTAESRTAFAALTDMLDAAGGRCRGETFRDNLRAEQAHLRLTQIELEQLEMRLAMGEQAFQGDAKADPDDRQRRQDAAHARQWEIAQSVPPEIRGQAFGALAK